MAERWITWKGKHLLVDDNGKIVNKKTPEIEEEEIKMGDISQKAMIMKDNKNNVIAYLKYLELNDMKKSDIYKKMFGGKRIAVQMIEVDKEHRRKGYATEMLKKLQSKHPDEDIRFGQLEPDGEKLLKKIANITDTELIEGHKRRTYYGNIK